MYDEGTGKRTPKPNKEHAVKLELDKLHGFTLKLWHERHYDKLDTSSCNLSHLCINISSLASNIVMRSSASDIYNT